MVELQKEIEKVLEWAKQKGLDHTDRAFLQQYSQRIHDIGFKEAERIYKK